ncbi:MAG: hypothetical protein GY787_03490 [Alteromonadales bacterium]|nr:hypothetical protein [Alteromonadales bacterium]
MAINFLNNVSVVETAALSYTGNKFVVLDSGVLKYRTGAQVRSDIGAGTGDITGVTAGTNLNGGATSGNATLNLDSAIELTSVQYGSGVTLSESSDRADLLYINSSTSSWGGLQIGNTSNEFIFSLMGDGSIGGIYDDQNNDWLIQWTENSEVRLYHNASERLNTSSSGVTITGDLTVTGGDIVLNGTGRIQGVDTVSSGTDAANKTYVDTAIAGVPQGDITAVTAGTNLTGGGTSGAVTINMATGGIGSGTYGSTANGTKIDNITVDAYGRVTAITTGATGSGNGTVTGSGNTNYVSKWTSSSAQGNSTIYDNGNVGIGTPNPSNPLHINSAYPQVRLQSTDDSTYTTMGSGNNYMVWDIINPTGNTYEWRSGGGAQMTITTSGNVGIGTAFPAAKLEVEGGDHLLQLSTTSSSGSPYISFNQAGSRKSYIQHQDSGDTLKLNSEYGGIDFYTGTTEKMTIQSDGDVGIGLTSPSSKLHVRKAAGPLSSFNSNTIGIYETSGPGYVNVVTGATSTGELWFSDSSEGRGRVRYNHSDDSLQFWVANGEKLRVGVSGQIGIGGTNYGSSGDVLTSNGSGSAPSWQAAGGGASVTSGTWTPSVTKSMTTTGLYPPNVTQAGYYEKIGDNVTVSFRLGFRAFNAAVNWTLTNITNLPYTVQNLDNSGYATSVQFLTYNSMSANTTTDAAYVAAGTTNVIFTESGNLTQTFTLPAYGISFVTGVVAYKAS